MSDNPVSPIHPNEILSLTDFQRRAKNHIKELGETGRPRILTVQGRAALVVQSPEAYHALQELARKAFEINEINEALSSKGIEKVWDRVSGE